MENAPEYSIIIVTFSQIEVVEDVGELLQL